MKNIILTVDHQDGDKLKKVLMQYDEIFSNITCFTKDDLRNRTSDLLDCEFVFSTWYMPVFSEEEIEMYFPSLKYLFYAAGTVKYFAEPFFKKGVRIFTSASANGIPVAEFTASQIVLAGKGYFQAQKSYKWPIWHRGFSNARGFAERKYGNYAAHIGIIGCGAIGSKVVELLKQYNFNILVYDPFLSDERTHNLGVKRVTLDEMFSCCDVISNHLPDIPETKGIINYDLLKLMKPTATIINTGRGAQIDEKALNTVLRKNKDMCALLDVTSHEPLYPWSPLYWRKNVFLTPHIAGSLSHEFNRMVEYMIWAYNDVLQGKSNHCETFIDVVSKQSMH